MFYNLLELSDVDDSSKWSNIAFEEEIIHTVSIEIKVTLLLWNSELYAIIIYLHSYVN